MHRPDDLWPAASTIQTPPVTEPITAAEAKLHLRVDHATEDDLIGDLIEAARRHVETANKWALITQTWDAYYDGFPATRSALVVPRPPLQSVAEVEYTDEDGNATILSSSLYNVDTDGFPGRIRLKRGETWPTDLLDTTNPVRVRFTAGYGANATDVPAPIRQAMLLLIGALYEHREPFVVGHVVNDVPFAVEALLDSYRPPVMA